LQDDVAEKSTLQQLLAGKSDAFVRLPSLQSGSPERPKTTSIREEVSQADEAAELQGSEEESEQCAVEFTSDDLEALSKVLNPLYLTPGTLSKLRDMFADDSYVLLGEILNEEAARVLESVLLEEEAQTLVPGQITPHGAGSGNGWHTQGPPHLERFLVANEVGESASSREMRQIATCLSSVPFRKWLALVTGTVSTSCKTMARRFRPGLDYSLATGHPKTLLHVNLCLTPSATTHQQSWDAGEAGGYASYMLPHADQDAAVYRAGAEEEDVLLTTAASWNQMTIVLRDEGILHFVKYVSALAPGSRFDVDAEYTIIAASDTEPSDQ
jgi:hypothetical protein